MARRVLSSWIASAAIAATLVGCGGSGAKEAATTEAAPSAPTQHFRSRPDLRPPVITVTTPAHGTAPGYVFIAPKRKVPQAGPLILDDAGHVVWFQPLDTHGITDFRAQILDGRPVLTWWRGRAEKGVGKGRYVILDSSYRQIATVRAGHGLSGDIHEFLITPQNTALFTIYRRVPVDLSARGGPRQGAINEGVVQEVDIASGRVLFEWHSYPEVALDESYAPVPHAKKGAKADEYDYFHVNSVDVDDDGDVLVSARNTRAIYKIDRSTNRVVWRLGGKRSDFAMGPNTHFAWQHDVRRQPDGTLSLFDNEARPKTDDQSRVLVLRLDETAMKATFVREYTHPKHLLSGTQGNAEFLPDGHVFVGWGENAYYTEFDRDGSVLLDVRFGGENVDSYRAYRLPWTGMPTDRPALALEDAEGGGTTVYASWNGATEVTAWRVLAGDDENDLAPVAEARRIGFETSIPVDSDTQWFAVQALAGDGTVLRASRPARRG